jgi:NAD(P)-dependent dehydrogenase (short-subunit alcohol dehydrogenase family)
VIALTKALACARPRGICVNSLAPGPIEAGMLLRGPAFSDEWLAAHVPLGRWGRASEVAASVALLAGDGGGYCVRQVLVAMDNAAADAAGIPAGARAPAERPGVRGRLVA